MARGKEGQRGCFKGQEGADSIGLVLCEDEALQRKTEGRDRPKIEHLPKAVVQRLQHRSSRLGATNPRQSMSYEVGKA